MKDSTVTCKKIAFSSANVAKTSPGQLESSSGDRSLAVEWSAAVLSRCAAFP